MDSAAARTVADVLRSEGAHAPEAPELRWPGLVGAMLLGSALFGAAMGTWSLSPLQGLYSALKTPLLLTCTSLVCLPNFYVLNAVLGLGGDMRASFRGIIAAQSTVALTLASLAPLTLFAYVSGVSYPGAKVVNGLIFLLASLAGQWTLRRHYARLIARDRRHRITVTAWLVLYQLVAIQLAWSLRPFIGSPDEVTTFFRDESFTNAFVEVTRAIRQVMTRDS